MRIKNKRLITAVQHLSWGLILCVMISCKPSVPKKYIQPGKMEKILYDYHLADGFANMGNQSNAVFYLASQEAVLRKHGVTQAEFDSSMVYYFRNTERLHDIYENVAKRLTEESKSLGGKVAGNYSSLSVKGDTANIWQGNRSEILLPTPPNNKWSFVIKTDTSFHQGDRVMLNYRSLFIFQEGVKDAVGVLAVRFNNDSVATRIQHLNSNTQVSLKIDDNERIGIKEIKGYVVLVNRLNEKSQTYKLLSIYDIQLIRMRARKGQLDAGEERDDLQEDIPKEFGTDVEGSSQPKNPKPTSPSVEIPQQHNIPHPMRTEIQNGPMIEKEDVSAVKESQPKLKVRR